MLTSRACRACKTPGELSLLLTRREKELSHKFSKVSTHKLKMQREVLSDECEEQGRRGAWRREAKEGWRARETCTTRAATAWRCFRMSILTSGYFIYHKMWMEEKGRWDVRVDGEPSVTKTWLFKFSPNPMYFNSPSSHSFFFACNLLGSFFVKGLRGRSLWISTWNSKITNSLFLLFF